MQTENIQKLIASWSDEKLHDVFAFNEDGRMNPLNTCCCIIGVHSSEVLHEHSGHELGRSHYLEAKYPGWTAERFLAGTVPDSDSLLYDAEREYIMMRPHHQHVMDSLLRAEMERRSAMRAKTKESHEHTEVVPAS